MLQTKNVFIDTQYYVKSGLHFEGAAFKAFLELCARGELTLLTTSVVEREVKSKIDDAIKDALQAVQTIQRKARILKSIEDGPLQNFFVPVEIDGVYESAKNAFDEFLGACNAEFAPVSDIDIEKILSNYFEKKPPFGDGKKKNEFPDAISLDAIEKYIDDEEVYVVSEDEDLKSYCNDNMKFHCVDTLDKLLDIYNARENFLSNAISSYIESNKDKISDEIKELLESADAWNESVWEDSELESYHVTSMSELDFSIVSIEENSCIVTFDISADFEVTVTGPDFTNGYWDGEDKVMIPMESTENTEIEEKNFLVELRMDFEIDGDSIINPEHYIYIDELRKGLVFSVDENSHDY